MPIKYTEKQLTNAQHCGQMAFSFSNTFIMLECSEGQARCAVEKDFYTEGSVLYNAYKRGALALEASFMQKLITATLSTDKEVRPFDKAAYDLAMQRRQANGETYETEKREYERQQGD